MFMHSWNVKVLVAAVLIIVQVFIYMAVSSRISNFTLLTFFICSLPGLIGALILWIEKNKGRF